MTSVRDQLAARRTEGKKTARGGQADEIAEATVPGQIKKAAKSGKLDLSSLQLDRVPSAVYTQLLGIPKEDLSSPPSPPPAASAPSASSSSPRDVLSLSKEAAFNQRASEVWSEPEELISLKMTDNTLVKLEREIGGFGGLSSVDLSHNRLTALPDSFADLLRLTTLDLSHNALSALPSSILLLPVLQVLDVSHNAIETPSFDNPVPPTDGGLSYGAGFLTTAFSRAQSKKDTRVLPALRSLNLGYNRIANEGAAALRKIEGKTLRVVNMERNALRGTLTAEDVGLDRTCAPDLATLNLSGNPGLLEVEGLSDGVKVDLSECGQPNGTAPTALANDASPSAPTAPHPGKGSGVPSPTITMVYRTCPAASFDAMPLDIDFDLYLPPTPTGKPLPLIIWFHGGGLLQGNKENLPPHFRRLPAHDFANGQHVAVLSPNYRLAPQTPIIDILSDITALLTFVRTKLNISLEKKGLVGCTIDETQICLTGGSAGGYLALIAGLPVPPTASEEEVGGYRGESGIKCIAPFYPITDLLDPFWSTEIEFAPWQRRRIPHEEAKPHIDSKALPVATAVSGGPRSILYAYMLQHSLFPSLLFQAQKSIRRGTESFRPTAASLSIPQRLALPSRAQLGKIPVYLIYGSVDGAVQKFDNTVQALRKVLGDKLEVEVREGEDHGFDEDEKEECEKFREWVGRVFIA